MHAEQPMEPYRSMLPIKILHHMLGQKPDHKQGQNTLLVGDKSPEEPIFTPGYKPNADGKDR